MKNLAKRQHGAGGYTFYPTDEKGNARFGMEKKKAILEAIQDSWTEGVYLTTNRTVKRQLLNGVAQFLEKDKETGKYYFA